MSEELLNIAKELSEKPTTELALQFMELTADNIVKDKEIDRLNNIINELEKLIKEEYDYCDKKLNPAFGVGMGVATRMLEKLTELKENK